MKKLLVGKYNQTLFLSSLFLILLNCIFTKHILLSDNVLSYKVFVVLANIGFSIIFVYVTSLMWWLFVPFFILVAFLGSILSYFKIFLGINFNESLLESVFNTNFEEASSVISYKLIVWVI